MSDETKKTEAAPAEGAAPAPKKHKKAVVAVVIVAVLVVAGIGFNIWHEQPSFCQTMCHIENTYVNNYSQPQNSVGTDKYGNEVSNTNAMMAVLHSHTDASAKPEIVCVDCHVPNNFELAHDGMNYVTGNYVYPRNERSDDDLMKWDNKDGTQFCVNENCHAYLRGADGKVDRDKLEQSTQRMDFNPHSQHHEGIEMTCTECHKGHRASVLECTGCHDDVELPDGWVTKEQSDEIMAHMHEAA